MLFSETKRLQRDMDEAGSYEEWKAAAIAHDKQSGVDEWKHSDESKHFDYESIRRRLKRLRKLKANKDYAGVMFALNEGIHGNIDGMGRSVLYGKAKFATKQLIVDYVDEVAEALNLLASEAADDIPFNDRLEFFHRAQHCYGSSALLMSGAGSLLFFHIGVVKTLWLENVLPDILSGSSGGAIVGSLVSTNKDKDIESLLEPENLTIEVEKGEGLLGLLSALRPRVTTADELEDIIHELVPDLTFQEAFEITGRHLNISVAAAEKHQTSRLLNAITTPNVYLREALMASTALPGVFPAVGLTAKNAQGKKQPYLASRKWVDGSISDDLPAKRLARVYGVNHFIVSQVNPHIFPFITDTKRKKDLFTTLKQATVRSAREWINAGASIMERPLSWNPAISRLSNTALSVINQDYFGDINILPDSRLFNPLKLLTVLDTEEIIELMSMGERVTWPKVEMIRIQTRISRTLDRIVTTMDRRDAQRRMGISQTG